MLRRVWLGVVCALCVVSTGWGQADSGGSLESYFTGRQVVLKFDMPGSQKGVDLKYNKSAPMDWNDYSSRIKTYGVALHKGDVARITKFVVKNDMIEFQLDGGGFGTAGDDSNTTVSATVVSKSQFEKDLEKQIAATTDARRRRDLQQDLDRERSRRERQNAANQNDAMIASQLKSQQVAERRLHGGSRFNLRWQGTIPSDLRNPDSVMQLLAEYVDFNVSHGAGNAPASQPAYSAQPAYNTQPQYGGPPPQYEPAQGGGDTVAQLKRGLRMDEVTQLLGRGKIVSQTTSNDGLKTQVIQYMTADSVVNVTYVEGVVVRYSMQSR